MSHLSHVSPLCAVFDRCEREQLSYCLLRDADEVGALANGGEVDLLVKPEHLARLRALLHESGFVAIPAWGRSPHHFFVHYDAAQDRWIKADVVTAVAFGRPVHSLRSPLAEACLERRRRVGAAYAPCAEDELVALLLHEMLDKGGFRPHRQARLISLRSEVRDVDRVSGHLRACWPGMTWTALAGAIDRGDWDGLFAQRTAVAAALAARDPLGTAVRERRDRALRLLFRAAGLVRPHAPSLALLAPDGAGKSTLVNGVEQHYFGPVSAVYMGLYQKSASRRTRWPGLGLPVLMLTQWRRYLNARRRQASGQLVLFDRYSYDALLPVRGGSTVMRRLRRWLLAWSVPAPDLTVILDAPGEMLFARKGEHSVDELERQRAAYRRLASRLPRATMVNAQQPPEAVRRDVNALIWKVLRQGQG